MKKLITLAVAVLAGALLFTGCYSEIAQDYDRESVAVVATAVPQVFPNEVAAEKADVSNRIWTKTGVAVALDTSYGNEPEIVEISELYGNKGKQAKINVSGSYAAAKITFETPLNLKGKSTITFKCKVDDGYVGKGASGLKIIFKTGKTNGGEVYPSYAVNPIASLSSTNDEYVDLKFNISTIPTSASYGMTGPVNLEKVDNIVINFQDDTGVIYIKDIVVQ